MGKKVRGAVNAPDFLFSPMKKQTTIHKCVSNQYTKVSNGLAQHKTLSLKARGLMLYLLSLPESWDINVEHLHKALACGRDAIRSSMGELRDAGYLALETVKDSENGRIVSRHWLAYDCPQDNQQAMSILLKTRSMGFPDDGKPDTRKEICEERKRVRKETLCSSASNAAEPDEECPDDSVDHDMWQIARETTIRVISSGKPVTNPTAYALGLARRMSNDRIATPHSP